MRLPSLAGMAALALALGACGSSGSGSSSASGSGTSSTAGSPAPMGGPRVVEKGLAFAPATVRAKVGETITFVNEDTPAHNVTPDGGVHFAGSPTMQPGASFHLKLTQAGTIDYFCSIHPFMKGTIVVTP